MPSAIAPRLSPEVLLRKWRRETSCRFRLDANDSVKLLFMGDRLIEVEDQARDHHAGWGLIHLTAAMRLGLSEVEKLHGFGRRLAIRGLRGFQLSDQQGLFFC